MSPDHAELPNGLQLGPYVIDSFLGAGGMGQVYRARDQRLDRPVAVKILPALFASNADRMRRFELEARLAGSLSHPNVLVVHDVGRYQDRPFIVEELLEGETLRDGMRGCFFAPHRAVEIARQVADGLAAAHAKGIVHRDLKPSNIFLCSDGPVKILDFGLAKLRDPQTLEGDPDTGSTTEGVLGTVGYLSPEQARGDHADPRADIFALGCVLYEMLTGRRAFAGTSVAEILAATLTKDPPNLSRTTPDVPPNLSRLVHQCLEKEAAGRFSSAHDLSLALESTRDNLVPPPWWRRRIYVTRRTRRAAQLVLLTAVIAAAAWTLPRAFSPDRAPEFRPRRVTSGPGFETEPAVSPDGRDVAYVATQGGNTDIWVADVRGGGSLRITHDEAAEASPAWFPDGRALVFVSERGGEATAIWKVDRLGGPPALLVSNARDPAISPDGTLIAFTRLVRGQDHRVAVAPLSDLDDVRILTADDDGLWDHRRPTWSPDSRSLCYEDIDSLWVVDVAGGPPRRLQPQGDVQVQPAWSADGRFVYYRSIRDGIAAIWRRPVKGGSPTRITLGVGAEHSPSLSRDGRWLAYGTLAEHEALVAFDTRTGRRGRFEDMRRIGTFAVAPDAGSVVFVSDRDDRPNLWRLPLGEAPLDDEPRRVTDHAGKSAWPSVSSDGRWIAYYRTIDGQRDVWVVPATGGPSLRFTEDPATDFLPVWSPDGSRIGFVSDRSGSFQIWVAEVRAGRRVGSPRQLTDAPTPVHRLAWSPDGRQLAFLAPHEGDDEVWLTDADGRGESRRITRGSQAVYLRWPRGTGRLLVSGLWGGQAISLRAVEPATGQTGAVSGTPWAERSPETGLFDVSSDERWLVRLEDSPRGDVWLLEATKGSF